MNLQLDAKGERQAVNLLRERAAAYLVMVFGSYAKGLARSDSDIDIAYAGKESLGPYEIFMLAQELAALLGRDVDLLDLTQASTVMKAQIVAFGRVLYCSDDVKRQYLFMRALGDYARLNGERAVVVDSIARRGSVYAD